MVYCILYFKIGPGKLDSLQITEFLQELINCISFISLHKIRISRKELLKFHWNVLEIELLQLIQQIRHEICFEFLVRENLQEEIIIHTFFSILLIQRVIELFQRNVPSFRVQFEVKFVETPLTLLIVSEIIPLVECILQHFERQFIDELILFFNSFLRRTGFQKTQYFIYFELEFLSILD